jgi:hypothetical protein
MQGEISDAIMTVLGYWLPVYLLLFYYWIMDGDYIISNFTNKQVKHNPSSTISSITYHASQIHKPKFRRLLRPP